MQVRCRWLTGLVVAAAVGPAGAENFADFFQCSNPGHCPLTAVGSALGRAVVRSIPTVSASSGLVFEYDVETGAFVRQPSVTGQLFLERAETLGRGKWNVGISYQYVSIDSVNGVDLDDLHDTNPISGFPGDTKGFTIPHLSIALQTHEVTASATYGLGDDTDLNLTVPVLYSNFELDGHFSNDPDRVHLAASKLGVGDVLVRAKQRVLRGDAGQLAVGLGLRLPSGSQDDFQGLGFVEVTPAVAFSSASLHVDRTVELQAFANASIGFDTEDVAHSEGRFGLGVDARLSRAVTLALAFLGREPFEAEAPSGATNVDRVQGGPAPIFGIDVTRPNIYDLSFGGRVVLWRDTLIGFANVLVPLNHDGARSDVIPLAGLEATF